MAKLIATKRIGPETFSGVSLWEKCKTMFRDFYVMHIKKLTRDLCLLSQLRGDFFLNDFPERHVYIVKYPAENRSDRNQRMERVS